MRRKVYRIVSQIPKGRVMTYGQVARRAGLRSARTVGMYLHANKDPENVPCHRVVFSDGTLSRSYAFGGWRKQKNKLEKEGVLFKKNKVSWL